MPKDKQQVKYSDQVRQSDITFWGGAALVAGAIAVLGANLPALLPDSFITSLHSTRLEGGNINSLRQQVSRLQAETIKIRGEYARLATQITIAEQSRGQVVRRVGALEGTIPIILQAVPPGVNIDSSISTASIDNNKNADNYDVEGGSVSVSNTPLEPSANQPVQALPNKIDARSPSNTNTVSEPLIVSENLGSGFGIALGKEVTLQDVYISWQEINTKIGTLLIGLEPLLSNENNKKQRLILGPVNSYAESEQLCTRIVRVGIACLPVPYSGQKMPN